MPRRKTDPPVPSDPDPPECIATFTGAGESHFVDKLTEKLWEAIDQAKSYSSRVEALEDATLAFHQKYWPIYPPDRRPDAEIIVSLWTRENSGLFKVTGPVITEISTYESIGFGVSMSKYISDRLYRSSMPMRDAAIIAIYMIEEVKEHVQWCGGKTQVLTIDIHGHTNFLINFDVEWGRRRFRQFDESLEPLMVAVGNYEISEDDFVKRLRNFISTMRDMRKELINLHRAMDAAMDDW
jgi:hypothetical protein